MVLEGVIEEGYGTRRGGNSGGDGVPVEVG